MNSARKKTVIIIGRHPSATLLGARLSRAGYKVTQYLNPVFGYGPEDILGSNRNLGSKNKFTENELTDDRTSPGQSTDFSVWNSYDSAWNPHTRTNRWPGFGFNDSEIQLGYHLLKEAGATESEIGKVMTPNRQPALGTSMGVLPISSNLNDWESEWAWCLGERELKNSGIYDELRNLDLLLVQAWNHLVDSSKNRSKNSGKQRGRSFGGRFSIRKSTLRRKLGLFSHSGTARYFEFKKNFLKEVTGLKKPIGKERISPNISLLNAQTQLGSAWNRLEILQSTLSALGVRGGNWKFSDFLILASLRKGFAQANGGNLEFERFCFDLAKRSGVELDSENFVQSVIVSGRTAKSVKLAGHSLPISCDFLFFAGARIEAEYLLKSGMRERSRKSAIRRSVTRNSETRNSGKGTIGNKENPSEKLDQRKGAGQKNSEMGVLKKGFQSETKGKLDTSLNGSHLAHDSTSDPMPDPFFEIKNEAKPNWKWKLGIEAQVKREHLPIQFLTRFSGILWSEAGAPPVWIEAGCSEPSDASLRENFKGRQEQSVKISVDHNDESLSSTAKISAEIDVGLENEVFSQEFQRKVQRRLQFLLGKVFPLLDLRQVEFTSSLEKVSDGFISCAQEVPLSLRRETRMHPPQWMYPKNFAFCGLADEDFLGRFGSVLQSIALYDDVLASEEV